MIYVWSHCSGVINVDPTKQTIFVNDILTAGQTQIEGEGHGALSFYAEVTCEYIYTHISMFS